MWGEQTYFQVRDIMHPGDVIAFGGKGRFSSAIKTITGAAVSHVGVIRQVKCRDGSRPGAFFNEIIESTTLTDDFAGVGTRRLSDVLQIYDGEAWWLPLAQEIRAAMDLQKYLTFLYQAEGRSYDYKQALQSGLDLLDRLGLTRAEEDFTKFFCSELVAGALEAAGAIPSMNVSEVTPIDLCRFAIYSGEYIQILGMEKQITAYNTIAPGEWR